MKYLILAIVAFSCFSCISTKKEIEQEKEVYMFTSFRERRFTLPL